MGVSKLGIEKGSSDLSNLEIEKIVSEHFDEVIQRVGKLFSQIVGNESSDIEVSWFNDSCGTDLKSTVSGRERFFEPVIPIYSEDGKKKVLIDSCGLSAYLGVAPSELEAWRDQGNLAERIDQRCRQIASTHLPIEFAKTKLGDILKHPVFPSQCEINDVAACRESNGRIVLFHPQRGLCWDLFGQKPIFKWRGKIGGRTVQVVPGHVFYHLKAGPMRYGKGAYKVCKLAQDLFSQKFVARLSAKYVHGFYEMQRQTKVGMEVLKRLQGTPGVVEQYAAVEAENKKHELGIVIYQRYYRHGDLKKAMDKHRFSSLQKAEISETLLTALAKMHEKRIYHRDLKLGNVLVDQSDLDPKRFDVAISDFDMASVEGKDLKVGCGTLELYAPERMAMHLVKDFSEVTEQSLEMNDVWGMGMILHALLLRKISIGNARSQL